MLRKLFLSIICMYFYGCNGSNDRIDDILARTVNMGKQMNQLIGVVNKLVQQEDDTSKKVIQLGDRVQKVVEKGVELETKVDGILVQMNDTKKRMIEEDKKMVKIGSDVLSSGLLSGWESIEGKGIWEDYQTVSAGRQSGW